MSESTQRSGQELRFEQDGLTITVSREPRESVIAWTGVSDARNPGLFLNPIVRQLTSILRGGSATIDLRGLEYINSATVTPLINLVKGLNTNQTEILMLYDTRIDWQRTNLQCMRTIARTLDHLAVEDRPDPTPRR